MNIFIKNRNFRYLLTSNILSVIGITLFDIVFIIYAKSFPNPELAISAVTFISTLPYLSDFLLGYVADKTRDRIKMFIKIRAFQASLYFIFALIVGFSQSWLVFGIVLLINLLSDLSGTYTTYLTLPITKNIVEQKYLTSARSFQTGVMNIIDLTGKLFGATLIILLNYNYTLFGLLNAFFFSLSCILFWVNRKNFYEVVEVVKKEKCENKIYIKMIKQFYIDSLNNLKILNSIRQIFHFTIVFSIMNLISSAQFSLIPLTFNKYEHLQFSSFGLTIALFGTIESLGLIIGALIPLGYFRNKSIESNLIMEIFLTCGIILNIIYIQDKYILFLLTFLSGYFLGLSNPRIDSFIMIITPENSLSSVTSIFYSIIQITVPIGSAIFLLMANTVSVEFSWFILLIISFILLFFSIILSKKYSTIPEKL
ncbi:MFS transporter [Lysinibacillus sp. NPDC093210]|uniref:MFS transporter n=1 Tax=Lysinibacillus sp. NPDC093210 TaxID=3364133 RepID=UPI00380263A3